MASTKTPNLCPCGHTPVVMTFEKDRHAVVCTHCHRHGKQGNSAKEATVRWDAKNPTTGKTV